MQDMLVPIFGEDGAIIIQYVVTLAVILGLVILVVWAIRHYGGGAARPTARARLPRLAVVDTLAIDNKRRLVLVRRDNVEHLVLIGGPSDVVVEPSIVRQRVAQRPGQPTPAGRATQPAVPAPQPPPPPPASSSHATTQAAPRVLPTRAPVAEPVPTENAIPFPPRRSPLRATERFLSPRRESTRTARAGAAAAAADSLTDPAITRRSPLPAKEAEPGIFDEPAGVSSAMPAQSFMAELADEPVPGYPLAPEDDQEVVSAFAPPASVPHPAAEPRATGDSSDAVEPVEAPYPPPVAETETHESAARAAEVSDLEKEMARLLDEISTSRRE